MYDAIFKIVLFGDAGCGKTTLTRRYMTNLFVSDTKMTIGVDFEVKTVEMDGLQIKLQIWDFGGEERFRFLLPRYIRGAHGGIFMFDITSLSSLYHFDEWLSVVRETGVKIPIMFIGGKVDLEDLRKVTYEECLAFAESRGFNRIIECSSRTGLNVERIFNEITRIILKG